MAPLRNMFDSLVLTILTQMHGARSQATGAMLNLTAFNDWSSGLSMLSAADGSVDSAQFRKIVAGRKNVAAEGESFSVCMPFTTSMSLNLALILNGQGGIFDSGCLDTSTTPPKLPYMTVQSLLSEGSAIVVDYSMHACWVGESTVAQKTIAVGDCFTDVWAQNYDHHYTVCFTEFCTANAIGATVNTVV